MMSSNPQYITQSSRFFSGCTTILLLIGGGFFGYGLQCYHGPNHIRFGMLAGFYAFALLPWIVAMFNRLTSSRIPFPFIEWHWTKTKKSICLRFARHPEDFSKAMPFLVLSSVLMIGVWAILAAYAINTVPRSSRSILIPLLFGWSAILPLFLGVVFMSRLRRLIAWTVVGFLLVGYLIPLIVLANSPQSIEWKIIGIISMWLCFFAPWPVLAALIRSCYPRTAWGVLASSALLLVGLAIAYA